MASVVPGRLEREEAGGSYRTEWIFSSIRNVSRGTREFFDVSAQQSLHSAGLPNRRDFEDAALRLERAEQRLSKLESASAPERADDEESGAESGSGNEAATGAS